MGLREQLSAAQHKTTKLTAARDKLEIILHDLETSSADEQQQLKHQLAAANKALRSSGQQLTAVQQQLAQIEQELADRQQQLDASTQQLLETQQHEAALQQQLAVAAEKLQQLEQQAAEAGSRAAPPVVVSAPAQVGIRHWLQAQDSGTPGPSPAPCCAGAAGPHAPLCLQLGCLCLMALPAAAHTACLLLAGMAGKPGCWHRAHGAHRGGLAGLGHAFVLFYIGRHGPLPLPITLYFPLPAADSSAVSA